SLAYMFGVLLAGAVLAFKIRNVNFLLYNESKFIIFSVYNVTFMMAIIVLLQGAFLGDDEGTREMVFVTRSVFVLLSSLVPVCVLFLPKLYYMYKGVDPMAPSSGSGSGSGRNKHSGSG